MLRQIGQQFDKLKQQLKDDVQQTATSRNLTDTPPEEEITAVLSLKDSDYEFLFNQLLEGITHGWYLRQIEEFFTRLERRASKEQWIDWLRRFGTKLLSSPVPNHELAGRMMKFGDLTKSLSSISEIGQVAFDIGRQLLIRGTHSPHPQPTTSPTPVSTAATATTAKSPSETEVIAPEPEIEVDTPVQTLSLAEILQKLQTKSHLVEQIIHKLQSTQSGTLCAPRSGSLRDRLSAPGQAWFKRGLAYAQKGDLPEAIACWQETVAIEPKLAVAWHNQGCALADLGEWAQASTCFEQVTYLKPDDYQGWSDLGNAFYHLQKWEEAISSWNKVLELKPDYYQVWYNCGCALEKLELIQEAIVNYEKALLFQPDFSLAESRLTNLQKKIEQKKKG